ncbi:unnamed protein product [Notodromas monacha]|uniref:VWFC domain-containing protein n=1 Tax=Notodromas monacha TaxID=399045 RepID=A0A7R9BQD6_9CRUS|nr:unnamed protein product [Notodromas monacha]CAG0918647.1 unnamed protein product [Notodromas monacha]
MQASAPTQQVGIRSAWPAAASVARHLARAAMGLTCNKTIPLFVLLVLVCGFAVLEAGPNPRPKPRARPNKNNNNNNNNGNGNKPADDQYDYENYDYDYYNSLTQKPNAPGKKPTAAPPQPPPPEDLDREEPAPPPGPTRGDTASALMGTTFCLDILTLPHKEPDPPPSPPQCTFEGESYRDGDEWRPDDCTRCMCDRGAINCETVSGCGSAAAPTTGSSPGGDSPIDCQYVICPEVDCATQSYVPLGQCCPVCAGTSKSVVPN